MSVPEAGAPETEEKAELDGSVPGYRERLAYGTDQGRWLVEEVGSRADAEGTAKRRSRPVVRAYHDLAEEPIAAAALRTSVEESSASRKRENSWEGFAIAGCAGLGALTLIFLFLRSFS
jgi:hypothetical protein